MSRVDHGGWFVGIDERIAILGDGQWTVLGTRTAMVRHARTTRSYRAGGPFSTAG